MNVLRKWKLRREAYRAAQRNDWLTAIAIAKQLHMDDLREMAALARAVQLLCDGAPQDGAGHDNRNAA